MRKIVDFAPRKTIDDTAFIRMIFNKMYDLTERVPLGLHFKKNIFTIKTRDKNPTSFHAEIFNNIGSHGSRCSRRQSKAHGIGKEMPHGSKFEIIGTEIVPPLADTVRFVDRNAAHFDAVGTKQIF